MLVHTVAIVSYGGDWRCTCGAQNCLWDACPCGKGGPCRDWVRGRCKYGDECRWAPLAQAAAAGGICSAGVPPHGAASPLPAPLACQASGQRCCTAAAQASASVGQQLAPSCAGLP